MIWVLFLMLNNRSPFFFESANKPIVQLKQRSSQDRCFKCPQHLPLCRECSLWILSFGNMPSFFY